ncbi:MAG: hypothetical protein JSS82_01200 [Bacteroidetes bacterium]|nr:hypothetical protein [Bacteroidota bacterium]
MSKILLTVFLVVLVPYVIVTISRVLKGGKAARTRFYIFLFVVMLLALTLIKIL